MAASRFRAAASELALLLLRSQIRQRSLPSSPLQSNNPPTSSATPKHFPEVPSSPIAPPQVPLPPHPTARAQEVKSAQAGTKTLGAEALAGVSFPPPLPPPPHQPHNSLSATTSPPTRCGRWQCHARTPPTVCSCVRRRGWEREGGESPRACLLQTLIAFPPLHSRQRRRGDELPASLSFLCELLLKHCGFPGAAWWLPSPGSTAASSAGFRSLVHHLSTTIAGRHLQHLQQPGKHPHALCG